MMQAHSDPNAPIRGGDRGGDIFRLSLNFRSPVGQRIFSRLQCPLESIVALNRLGAIYATMRAEQECEEFIEAVFSELDIHCEVSPVDVARIPSQGPVIVVANHPFGAIEGLVLLHVLRSVRPDVKIMANYLLGRIPQMRDGLIFVDPFGTAASSRANLRGLRETLRFVEGGGMLAVFPAGTVSHLHLWKLQITDPAWSPTIARIVRHTGAPVLPVFFAGCNGPLFQVIGLAHPLLRTAMLPRAMLKKRGHSVEVRVGDLIPSRKLCACSDQEMMAVLRERTYLLRMRRPALPRLRIPTWRTKAGKVPIAAAEDPALLTAEVNALPAETVLVTRGDYVVCCAAAAQIPHVLREIGRLRELSFRGAGEGSGKSLDLDAFDEYYEHLFVWNRQKSEVVGAYRIARADEVARRRGVRGLYTSTLFQFSRKLFDRLGPSLEMGRSFVRPEYQRSYAGLLLLWRGIGELVCREPRYKVLFGPVSISSGYQLISRQLIVAYLRANQQMHPCAHLVRPRHPFRRAAPGITQRGLASAVLEDLESVEDISSVVSHIEADQKGVPVMLREYLKLGASPLGFNVDPDFSDVLDVLVLVDLTRTDPKVLERYIMGPEGARKFLEYHAGGGRQAVDEAAGGAVG